MPMKKNAFLILLILAIFSLRTSAQEDGSGSSAFGSISLDNLNYGIKAGMNSFYYATNGKKLAGSQNKVGLTVGAFGEYEINDMLGVSVEVLYAQSGAKMVDPAYLYSPRLRNITGDSYSLYKANSNIVMHNLEIPVCVKLSLPETMGVKPKLIAGFSFDFTKRVYAYNKVIQVQNGQTMAFNNRWEDDVTSNFHNYHTGLILGAGFGYDMFTVDLIYKYDLSPATSKSFYTLSDSAMTNMADNKVPDNLYSRGFTVTLGVNVNELIEKF